jgi:2'-5' RNA ligase
LPSNSNKIRSFIAIELPEEVKGGLARLRDKLERAEHTFVKWVDTGGIHLTLKFLGNIYFKQIAEITEVMKEASQEVSPFQLQISGLGAFPNLKQPRVVWVGVFGEVDRLLRLQQNIDSALVPLGFAREERPFTPHLTLARVRQGASSIQIKSFGDLVTSTNFEMSYSFEVKSVNLMKSQLMPQGAIYTRLSSARLEVRKT